MNESMNHSNNKNESHKEINEQKNIKEKQQKQTLNRIQFLLKNSIRMGIELDIWEFVDWKQINEQNTKTKKIMQCIGSGIDNVRFRSCQVL